MDVSVAIALYTVMIGVITLLGGFYFVVGSRLVVELSESMGRGLYWKSGYKDLISDADKQYGDLLGRTKDLIKNRVGEIGKREALEARLERVGQDIRKWIDTLKRMVGTVNHAVREIKTIRDGFFDVIFSELVVMVSGVVILIVLLSSIGSVYWEYGVWIAWGVFLFEVLFCMKAVWTIVDLSNLSTEVLEHMKLKIEGYYEEITGQKWTEAIFGELRTLERKLKKVEQGD